MADAHRPEAAMLEQQQLFCQSLSLFIVFSFHLFGCQASFLAESSLEQSVTPQCLWFLLLFISSNGPWKKKTIRRKSTIGDQKSIHHRAFAGIRHGHWEIQHATIQLWRAKLVQMTHGFKSLLDYFPYNRSTLICRRIHCHWKSPFFTHQMMQRSPNIP